MKSEKGRVNWQRDYWRSEQKGCDWRECDSKERSSSLWIWKKSTRRNSQSTV